MERELNMADEKEMLAGSFTKLRDGRWGIRVEGVLKLEQEAEILCTKKDGTEDVVKAKCFWTGNHGGGDVSLCNIIREKAEDGEEKPGKKKRKPSKKEDPDPVIEPDYDADSDGFEAVGDDGGD